MKQKRVLRCCLFGFTLVITGAVVDATPWIDGCGDFSLGGELLYWRHGYCDYEYAELQRFEERELIQTMHYVEPEFNWGGRGRLVYEYSCLSAELSGLWWESRSQATARLPPGEEFAFLTNRTLGVGGNVIDGSEWTRYWNINLQLGAAAHRGCGWDFVFFGTARYIDLTDVIRATGVGLPVDEIVPLSRGVNRIEVQAGGLGIGVGGDFCLCSGLRALVQAHAMGFFGSFSGDRQGSLSSSTQRLIFHHPYPSRIIRFPGIDFHLGLSYTTCWCAMEIEANIGYEYHAYYGAFYQNQPASGPRHAVFGGPTLGLRIGY